MIPFSRPGRVAAASAAALLASLSLAATSLAAAPDLRGPVVYTLSNATAALGGNAVLAFAARPDGRLGPAHSYASGGAGAGTSLASQGEVAVSADGRHLVAVNAGSNSVTAFAVGDSGALDRLDTVPSGGLMPVSVTIRGDLAYALNAGNNTIAGFRRGPAGPQPVTGDVQSLSTGAAGAAEIAFSPDGLHLLVTEKASNTWTRSPCVPTAWPARPSPPPWPG